MEIRAYNELYLPNAMTTLATMLDYAVNVCNEDIDLFFHSFIISPVSAQFEQGSPMVITGKTGAELYRMVKLNYFSNLPEYTALDRSPEYWVGWSLAFYQWYANRTFREIIAVVQPSEMLSWYPTLHEADRMRFVEELDRRLMQRPTNLEVLRRKANLSQTDLANLSGVSLRSIQMYEQRRNDIAKAQFNILNALARSLGCNIYELMDSSTKLYESIPPTDNAFMLELQEKTKRNLEERERLLQEQKRLTEQLETYRHGYFTQVPCQHISGNSCYVQPQQFQQNWEQYWINALNHPAVPEVAQTNARKAIKEIGHKVIDSYEEPAASIAYDTMCLLTADNLFDATKEVINLIEHIMQAGKKI